MTRKKFWYWSILIIAAAGAATLVLIKVMEPEDEIVAPVNENTGISETLPVGYQYRTPRAGELPDGFPKNLILAKDMEILRGEDTLDAAGMKQKIVEYSTVAPATEMISEYETQLPKLGWKATGSYDQGGVKILNFTKGKDALDVIVFSLNPKVTQVSLTMRLGQ